MEKMDFAKAKAGAEQISVSNSFVVDIEGFSHVADRDNSADSTISRNHSRKGSTPDGGGGGEKKINLTAANGTAAVVEASTTDKVPLDGGGSPENPVVVALGAINHATSPKMQHQITIKKCSLSPPAESKHRRKRSRSRHYRLAWSTDPKRIVVFFATLSSMGSVLLIYLTLSMSKLNDGGLQ